MRHIKTGNVYRIIYTPASCRIEETNTPAYAYRLVKAGLTGAYAEGPVWVRAQAVMEDGRFELVTPI